MFELIVGVNLNIISGMLVFKKLLDWTNAIVKVEKEDNETDITNMNLDDLVFESFESETKINDFSEISNRLQKDEKPSLSLTKNQNKNLNYNYDGMTVETEEYRKEMDDLILMHLDDVQGKNPHFIYNQDNNKIENEKAIQRELDQLIIENLSEDQEETYCESRLTLINEKMNNKNNENQIFKSNFSELFGEKFLNKKRSKSKMEKTKNLKIKKWLKLKKFKDNSLENKFIEIVKTITHNQLNNNTNLNNKISITSYNILNQLYMKKYGREDLSLENRMTKIIHDLRLLNSDIICLQEADLQVNKLFLSNSLTEYYFVYGINCGSSFINIIGFKKNKYKLVSFKNFSLIDIKVVGNRGVMNIILEEIANKEVFSIYNIHLPWRFENERCLILERAFKHMLECDIKKVILAGDFNSEPESVPIKLIYYDKFLSDLVWTKNESKNKNIRNKNLTLSSDLLDFEKLTTFDSVYHHFNFRSAYENYKKYIIHKKKKKVSKSNYITSDFHPDYTSCTEYFKNTIDYIFHSNQFKLTKILQIPQIDEEFLPSRRFPSDHLKIYAEYEY